MRRSGEEMHATVRWSSLTSTDMLGEVVGSLRRANAARVGAQIVVDLAP
jgi:hypothetical protein